MADNLALLYLQDIDNYEGKIKNLNLNCKILFLRVNDGDVVHYAYKDSSSANPDNIIHPKHPSWEFGEEVEFESIFRASCNKMCNYTVNKYYINEQYENSMYSFLLFTNESKKQLRNNRRLTKKFTPHNNKLETAGAVIKRKMLNICGFVFLTEPQNNINNDIYLPLICARPGIGSKLLSLAENFSRDMGYNNLLLTSLETPLGFYLKKKYKIKKGKNIFPLSEKARVKLFKSIGNNIAFDDNLKRHGLVMNNLGITRKVSNLASILPLPLDANVNNARNPRFNKKLSNRIKRHRFLNPKTKVSHLNKVNVNHQNDGVKMYRALSV